MAWHVVCVGSPCRKSTIINVIKIICLLSIASTVTGDSRVNLAYRKPAYQSSKSHSALASRAVDGNTNTDFFRRSCTHTGEWANARYKPWWVVDLKGDYTIIDLEITNPDLSERRLSNFDVKVGSVFSKKNFHDSSYRSCAHYPGTVPDGITLGIQCTQPTSGRYVMVRLRGSNPLTLCEVKIFAAKASTEICRFGFDKRCIFPCRCEYNRVCDEQTGACPKRCMDSKPPGHRWSGTGCLIGNVAYGKEAHQVGASDDRHSYYAVDGKTEDSRHTKKFCAQPYSENTEEFAWWYVDLNGTYAVNKVVVYNTRSEVYPLAHVTVRIGMTKTINDQDVCDSYSGRVPNGHSFPCDGKQGRYVSIKRNGGSDINTFTLCEVLVIGHEYIDVDCESCLTKECTNHITGCSICDGKLPPDCKKDCPPGFYGKNCVLPCGHCLEPAQCVGKTGECRTGCMQWYGLSTCTQTIDAVDMTTSGSPDLLNVTSSSIVITWRPTSSVISGLESHYTYIVRAICDDNSSRIDAEARISHVATETLMEKSLEDLLYNTQYLIDVRLEAKHYDQTRIGRPTLQLSVKTNCKAPEKPNIRKVLSSVGWLNITYNVADSGCDYYRNITVEYRHLLDNQWTSVLVDEDSSLISIGNLKEGDYYVRISAINNQRMRTFSDQKFVAFTKLTTSTHQTSEKNPETERGNQAGSESGKGIGAIVGAVVAVIVVIVLVIAVVFFVLRFRKRKTSAEPGTLRQQSAYTIPYETSNKRLGTVPQRIAYTIPYETDNEGHINELQSDVTDNPYEYIKPLKQPSFPSKIKVADMAMYVLRNEGIKFNFKNLSPGLGEAALIRNACEYKDRFPHIRPYEDSRVILEKDARNPNSIYINASFITGYPDVPEAFVACQGPTENTKNDMWRMVWQLKSTRIVMLTRLTEGGRSKCSPYWPEAIDNLQKFDRISVTKVEEKIYADFTTRVFKLRREDETREVRHFQYTAWPHNDVPSSAITLLSLRNIIQPHGDRRPIIVHCSDGVGRTGTYIALDLLLQEGLAEGKVDIAGCVNRLRNERIQMVQTEAQYVFLHNALLDGLRSNAHTYACSDFCTKYKNQLGTTNSPEIIRQYDELEIRRSQWDTGNNPVGLQAFNLTKNRDRTIIPLDNHRPSLPTSELYKSDYINGSYVNGYHTRGEFIVTQLPLTETIEDFWRMVVAHNIPFIVTLDKVQTETEAFTPTKDHPVIVYGSVKVSLMTNDTKRSRHYDIKQYKFTDLDHVSRLPRNTVCRVKHLVTKWPPNKTKLPNTDVILELVDVINEHSRKQEHSGPIVVQCRDGVTRSGIVCAMCYCLMKMQVEQTVDIFSTVQLIRSYRKQLITDINQFHYLHQAAYDKLSMDSTYANAT